jgi:hypothetical protein
VESICSTVRQNERLTDSLHVPIRCLFSTDTLHSMQGSSWRARLPDRSPSLTRPLFRLRMTHRQRSREYVPRMSTLNPRWTRTRTRRRYDSGTFGGSITNPLFAETMPSRTYEYKYGSLVYRTLIVASSPRHAMRLPWLRRRVLGQPSNSARRTLPVEPAKISRCGMKRS